MKVFTCSDFNGVWPVGVSAVIVSPNLAGAKQRLYHQLKKIGLGESNSDGDFTLQEVDTNVPTTIILQDGDY